MRLLVFADLHLDAPFAWTLPDVARKRRQSLRDTLSKILDLAFKVDADAILCGGDLYEQERFTPDTREFLRSTLAAFERPVLLSPGNHDWYGPRSLYAQVQWSDNVHVFTEDHLVPCEIADGLTVWGAAFHGPTKTDGFLSQDFRARRGGVHVALFHGSEKSGLRFEGERKSAHGPFDAQDIERSGLRHAFVGHHHRPIDAPFYTYPGNPDPLTFGEEGQRGAVVVDLGHDGVVRRKRYMVAASQFHDLGIDVGGCTSLQDIRDRIESRLRRLHGIARLTVSGELAPDISLNVRALRDVPNELDDIVIRTGDLHELYDYDVISKEPSVRGQFVRDVLQSKDLDDHDRRRVIVTGLRALDGRDDLEVP